MDKKLFICGNGFDLHHRLPTSYGEYAVYLANNNYSAFMGYNDFQYLNDQYPWGNSFAPWSDIESSLNIDYSGLMENAVDEDYPNVLSDTDSTWDDMWVNVGVITDFIDEFTGKSFYQWISQVDCSIAVPDLRLPDNALYLSFNYTDTLQTLYGIPDANVLHIHGAVKNIARNYANSDEIRKEIQFGSADLNPVLVHEKLEQKYGNDDFYGASIRLAVERLDRFVQRASKNISNNYNKLKKFIENKKIDEVIIMGHTLTASDYAYYRDVLIPQLYNAKWTIMHHDNGKEDSMDDIKRFLLWTNLKNYEILEW